MYCNNCGTQMADGAKFCPKCGIKMDIQNPANQNPVNQSMGSPNMGNQNMGNQIPNNNYQPNPEPVYYAADSGELPMRWYKFVIWVQLFLNALLNIVSGIMTMTGAHYQGHATAVYMVCGSLKGLDIVIGIMMLVLAGGAIWVRQMLSKFQKMGPTAYVILLASNGIVSLIYAIMVSAITRLNAFSATVISQIVAIIALCICNYIYFNKRKSMFVN
ncbi:putative uncharacterized protein [Firmicutes bacterium CAG:227]|nr:putative uncharacterized protein [Firmicutes bacterium CAG:227]